MPFYSELFKRLSDFEISPNLLWIAGVSFVVAFIFLTREFFSWLVKQNEVRRELSEIKTELESLRGLFMESKSPHVDSLSALPPSFPLVIKENPESIKDQPFEN